MMITSIEMMSPLPRQQKVTPWLQSRRNNQATLTRIFPKATRSCNLCDFGS